MTLGIITSAAYINPEMAAEFGMLPPAFLPLGNSRLFKLQAELLRRFVDRIVLSLPASFEVPAHDQDLLARLEIETLAIEDGLALSESILFAVIQSTNSEEPLYILHGDTLFLGADAFPADGFSVHSGEQAYPWAMLRERTPVRISAIDDASRDGAALVSGLFSFSQSHAFLKCLAGAKRNFLAALNAYASQHPSFGAVEDCGRWLDLGHLNTYYDSCRALTTERAFNALSISRNTVSKTGAPREKIDAEARWFEALPPPLKTYVPTYIGRTGPDRAGYSLAYEYLCPLSNLFVFGALAPVVWRRILRSCRQVMDLMRDQKPAASESLCLDYLYRDKTVERFQIYAEQIGICPRTGWCVNGRTFPSPLSVIERMVDVIGASDAGEIGILHGDFCFSNILFDFRRNDIKLIDPRGYCEPGRPSVYGDTRYDLGKLHHSVFGRYDFIVAGYYALTRTDSYTLTFSSAAAAGQADIERCFREVICAGDVERERVAAAISVLLFFSMLPLHADDTQRQLAFLANAYRIYDLYFGAVQ